MLWSEMTVAGTTEIWACEESVLAGRAVDYDMAFIIAVPLEALTAVTGQAMNAFSCIIGASANSTIFKKPL